MPEGGGSPEVIPFSPVKATVASEQAKQASQVAQNHFGPLLPGGVKHLRARPSQKRGKMAMQKNELSAMSKCMCVCVCVCAEPRSGTG